MKETTVNKSELLAILKENRSKHRDIFLRAQEGFRSKVIETLEKTLKDARDGKKFPGSIEIPEPEDRTCDYDRAIKMIEMDVGNAIKLEETDFKQFVMDDWHWKRSFFASNVRYTEIDGVTAVDDDGPFG